MLVSKNHLALAGLASKDDSRPLLMQIKVYKEDGKVVAVATDSYILGEVIEETPAIEDFPNLKDGVEPKPTDEAFIERSIAERAKKTLTAKAILPVLGYGLLEKDALTTTNLDTATVHTLRPVEGNYPEYRKLIPEPAEFSVTLNPKNLIKALKMFDEHESMTIEFGEKRLDPVILRSNSGGVKKTVVVMPLKS